MLCRERLTQADCFVDSLLPHGPRQIFLFMLWKRSQDVNSHSAGSLNSSRGLLFPLHLGSRQASTFPRGLDDHLLHLGQGQPQAGLCVSNSHLSGRR